MAFRLDRGTYPETLRAVAAHGLPGTLLEMPTTPLDDTAFTKLHSQVRLQKLTGLFWAAARDGAFPVTASQRDRIEESHIQALAAVLLLEDLLLRTVERLSRSGIPVRALKGTVSAHLDHQDVSHRTFGDIDLLVSSGFYDKAVSTLVADGCQRSYPEPRPGFDRRFGKGTSLHTPDGLEIDLHRTFTMGPYGESLALDELWKDSDSFTVAGTTVQALTQEARLLHAAYHAALGDRVPQLVPLRDVAQILLTKEVDWQRLRDLMRASHGEAVVARAIRTTWDELRLADVLFASAWAAAYHQARRDTAHLSVYGTSSNYAARSFAAVRTIPLTQRPRYVFALAFPERSYLQGRHSGLGRRLLRGVADIRENRSR